MRKIHIIVVLIVSLLLLVVSTAWCFGEIRYPDRPLNLRKGRSATDAWVGSLYPGQKVRIGFMKDGWVAVFEPDETRNSESVAVGYSNVKYLKKNQTRVEPASWGEFVQTVRKLNVRSIASVKGRKIKTLQVMELVKIDFPEDDWTMVFSPQATIRSNMNAIGYSSVKYFKPATSKSLARLGEGNKKSVQESLSAPVVVSVAVEVPSGQGQVSGAVVPPLAPVSVPVKSSKSWGTVVTVKGKVNVRKGRTSGSPHVRTLKPGERVRVDFLKNGWYAVFKEDEMIRTESRAAGYALQSLIEADEKTMVSSVEVSKEIPAAKSIGGEKKTMVIDRSQFKDIKRPDPTPDKTAHGYQYRIVEKSETKQLGETWITIKVFLLTKKLPDTEALKDFSTTLWREHKKAMKNVVVLVYLPGMDLEDLSFGVTKFDEEQMLELWVRKAALFGTNFL
ncbi:MAG: SH3 domain-containing protein [Pseudodesulfovibrio sp.]|nr:SH3 domain-containing protein [Pseudodesulfovibrio sp.]